MTQGATFSHIYGYSYTGTHGDPRSWLRQDSQRNTRAKRGPKHPQLSPVSDLRRKTVGVKGLLQHAAPAQSLGSAPPRGVLVTPRTLSDGRRERARGLALSRPSPL